MEKKSVGLAIALGAFLGPCGMFYTTASGALVMIPIVALSALFTMGLALLITWPACAIWNGMAAMTHNEALEAAQKAIAEGPPGDPEVTRADDLRRDDALSGNASTSSPG